jgi:hypothetical protein
LVVIICAKIYPPVTSNGKVMLIITFKFGNYRARLMISKPTKLSIEWLPKMPLLSPVRISYFCLLKMPGREDSRTPGNLLKCYLIFPFLNIPFGVP